MQLQIISNKLLPTFLKKVTFDPIVKIDEIDDTLIKVDYFQFYNSISSVYSSKIEGEDIDFDSYYKHKFLNIKFQTDYTKKADDLFKAYEFIEHHILNEDNLMKSHSVLSKNLLPLSLQGKTRNNPMFVINNLDRIEYVAADPKIINSALSKLFHDIQYLFHTEIEPKAIFYYAAYIH